MTFKDSSFKPFVAPLERNGFGGADPGLEHKKKANNALSLRCIQPPSATESSRKRGKYLEDIPLHLYFPSERIRWIKRGVKTGKKKSCCCYAYYILMWRRIRDEVWKVATKENQNFSFLVRDTLLILHVTALQIYNKSILYTHSIYINPTTVDKSIPSVNIPDFNDTFRQREREKKTSFPCRFCRERVNRIDRERWRRSRVPLGDVFSDKKKANARRPDALPLRDALLYYSRV